MGSSYKILIDKSKGRRPLGIPERRCEDNIKIKLTAIA
jgi:hypothetical protein